MPLFAIKAALIMASVVDRDYVSGLVTAHFVAREQGNAMNDTTYRTALIVGVGAGLSASLARTFSKAGMTIALAARRAGELSALAAEVRGKLCEIAVRATGPRIAFDATVGRALGGELVPSELSSRTTCTVVVAGLAS